MSGARKWSTCRAKPTRTPMDVLSVVNWLAIFESAKRLECGELALLLIRICNPKGIPPQSPATVFSLQALFLVSWRFLFPWRGTWSPGL